MSWKLCDRRAQRTADAAEVYVPEDRGACEENEFGVCKLFVCSLKTLTDSVLRKLTRIGSPTLWDTHYPTSPALLHEATLLSSVLSPSSL